MQPPPGAGAFPVQVIEYPPFRDEIKRIALDDNSRAAIDACRALVPELRAQSREMDKTQRLPENIVQKMADIGCYIAGAPEEVGGGGWHYATYFRVMEELGRGNASAGWSVLVHLAAATLAMNLPLSGAQKLFSSRRTVIAGTPGAMGKAVRVDGGFRIVDGEWAWASNTLHATHYIGGFAVVEDAAAPVPSFPPKPGEPPVEMFIGYFPVTDGAVVEGSWDTLGLRGTHSGRFRLDDAFIPHDMAFARFDPDRVQLTAQAPHGIGGHAAVLLGATRHALEYFYALGKAKAPVAVGMAGGSLIERPVVQYKIAEVEAKLRAARALFYEVIDDCWARFEEGEHIGKPDHLVSQLMNTYLARTCVECVQAIHELCGTTGVFRESPLEQILRDVQTGQSHMAIQAKNYESYGKAFVGLPAMIFDVF
ncbi:MAG: acyl-CoA dehydrogenase family protein [Sphingomonadaceae bacterium]|nr:acyl-CoA dehydrogenase family protein [Sphingomonadaceae bacterium]